MYAGSGPRRISATPAIIAAATPSITTASAVLLNVDLPRATAM
jgi:hypothetical protein